MYDLLKALEKEHIFGPRTLVRVWGTRPEGWALWVRLVVLSDPGPVVLFRARDMLDSDEAS